MKPWDRQSTGGSLRAPSRQAAPWGEKGVRRTPLKHRRSQLAGSNFLTFTKCHLHDCFGMKRKAFCTHTPHFSSNYKFPLKHKQGTSKENNPPFGGHTHTCVWFDLPVSDCEIREYFFFLISKVPLYVVSGNV